MTTAALESHILSVCSAIGGIEEAIDTTGKLIEKYVPGDECLECLRDLKQFLRYDETNKTHVIAKILGRWQLIQRDLIPIIEHYFTNSALLEAAVELLVRLTWPLNNSDQLSLELVQYHLAYKQALVHSKVVDTLFEEWVRMLEVPFQKRTDRHQHLLRMCLYFFRNLLAIQDADSTADPWASSREKDQLLRKYQSIDFLEMLVVLTSSITERPYLTWNAILLEIMYLIFHGYDPKTLQTSFVNRSNERFQLLLEKEAKEKKVPTPRHSRFRGTFSVVQQDGSKFNVHSHSQSIHSLDDKKRVHRVKRTSVNTKTMVLPANSTLQLLTTFVNDFVTHGFQPLLQSIAKDLERSRPHLHSDTETHFFSVVQFVCQLEPPPYTSLSFLLTPQGLSFLLRRMRSCMDDMTSPLPAAITCLHAYFEVVQFMLSVPEMDVTALAQQLINHFYYEKTSFELLVHLVKYPSLHLGVSLEAVVALMYRVLKLLRSKDNNTLVMRQLQKKKSSAHFLEEEEMASDQAMNDKSSKPSPPVFIEKEVNVYQLEHWLCHPLVVATYMLVIANAKNMSSFTLRASAKMIAMIAFQHQCPVYFFKLHYLHYLHQALVTLHSFMDPEVIQVLKKLIHVFFECLERSPLLLLHVFFPFTARDNARMYRGEEETRLPSTKLPVIFEAGDEVRWAIRDLSNEEKLYALVSCFKTKYPDHPALEHLENGFVHVLHQKSKSHDPIEASFLLPLTDSHYPEIKKLLMDVPGITLTEFNHEMMVKVSETVSFSSIETWISWLNHARSQQDLCVRDQAAFEFVKRKKKRKPSSTKSLTSAMDEDGKEIDQDEDQVQNDDEVIENGVIGSRQVVLQSLLSHSVTSFDEKATTTIPPSKDQLPFSNVFEQLFDVSDSSGYSSTSTSSTSFLSDDETSSRSVSKKRRKIEKKKKTKHGDTQLEKSDEQKSPTFLLYIQSVSVI
ncbi:Topoisomerase 1-associated factor 1 [Coelomomyces lativittatus]|nr:Topoisomerase 1-associated factor 1 [Coelomomyces lativittatus]